MKRPALFSNNLMIAVALILSVLTLWGAFVKISERKAAAQARIMAEWQELQRRAIEYPYQERR